MAGRGGHLPAGAKTIAIPVFSNKTLEPIVEEELTPAVIREFMKDGRIEVVDDAEVLNAQRITAAFGAFQGLAGIRLVRE
jgi:hypothetical protein